MKVAMLVGALMFSLVSGLYDIGLLDMVDVVGSPDNQAGLQALPNDQKAVHSFEDYFPPPPNWP
jgi:hypothetical protein